MVTSTPERTSSPDAVRTPTVLAVLVVRDGIAWLRECLRSLAQQTHPRIAVVAVDVASTDGSSELLHQALGAGRVLVLGEQADIAEAVRAAVDLPVAAAADYLLVVHDDTALAPDAVARMLDAAEGIEGVERVGVVGPKVVDWDDPRVLREVGRSTDRFGHPYTPLVDGEMDQGQYDRVLEVLYVSSCAMLVSREAWQRAGLFDERLTGDHDDLDLCWRVRIAGFRVLMTPLAQARHRGASARGERREPRRRRTALYYAERAALAAMLKNYGVVSLLWLLPLHVVTSVARLLFLALSRRFEDAYEILSAWTWNLVHLPSTIGRRVRAQSVRTVRDRSVRRFMQSTWFRAPRWFQAAERILEEQLEGEREQVPIRSRASSLAMEHPALLAWTVGLGVAVLAYLELIDPRPLEGGALASFPASASAFFHELGSGFRTTGLGGDHAASPALALLGGASWISTTALAQKAVLMVTPILAGVFQYRAIARQTGERSVAAVSAGAYALSGIVLWSFSGGRIGMLVALAILPLGADMLDQIFGAHGPAFRLRRVVAIGAVLAVGVAFLPGIALGVALLALGSIVSGPRRSRGALLAAAAGIVGAVLVFPMLPDLVGAPGAAFGSHVGTTDFWLLTRLTPGGGQGAWLVSWFLPLSALIAFSVVGREHARRAWRGMAVAVAALFLAWGSSAGYLPEAASNAPVYLAVAAVAEASVLAMGLATLAAGIGRQAFGYRQIAAVTVSVVLVAGGVGQLFGLALGTWEIDANALPSAWPAVATSPGEFRVLWLGAPDGERFPAPGGDPQGVVDAGVASVAFAIGDRDGVSALDIGRGATGAGYEYLRRALAEIVAGQTSHGGALLGPLGVRFVVAGVGDLPASVRTRLDAQLDLDLEPAGGLVVFRNARALPVAVSTDDGAFSSAAHASDLREIARLSEVDSASTERTPSGWRRQDGAGTFVVSTEYDDGWAADPGGIEPFRAFGWALGSPRGTTALRFDGQWVRTAQMALLAALWLAVLWITRRPASR
jgi:GT2 family glycosyltransferase